MVCGGGLRKSLEICGIRVVKMGDGKCIYDRVRSKSMGLKCMEKNT